MNKIISIFIVVGVFFMASPPGSASAQVIVRVVPRPPVIIRPYCGSVVLGYRIPRHRRILVAPAPIVYYRRGVIR